MDGALISIKQKIMRRKILLARQYLLHSCPSYFLRRFICRKCPIAVIEKQTKSFLEIRIHGHASRLVFGRGYFHQPDGPWFVDECLIFTLQHHEFSPFNIHQNESLLASSPSQAGDLVALQI